MTEVRDREERAADGRPSRVRDGRGDEKSAWGWLPLTVQALAAVGALAYSTIHVSFQNFYDAVGVTPESVGATSTTILAQSSLRVIEFGVLFALVPVVLVLLAFLALDRWEPHLWLDRLVDRSRIPTTPPLRRTSRRFVLALFALVPYPLYQRMTHGRTYSFVVVFSLIALLVLAWLLRDVDRLRPRQLRSGSAAVVVVLWMGLAVCWIVLTSLSDDATAAGKCVQHGVAVQYVHTHRHLPFLARIPVLRVQAEPVADASKLGARKGATLLYLGESGGTAVVWNATAQRTLLLPAATSIALVPVRPRVKRSDLCHAYVS